MNHGYSANVCEHIHQHFKKEQKALGYKSSEECLTIMIYNNAMGTHKLKLVDIGKSRKHRSFKGSRAEKPALLYLRKKKAGWIMKHLKSSLK